jgi:thiamine-monophosphate kinase
VTSPEFELIRRFFTRPARRAVLGVGDDCALWQPPAGMECAVSTDMLVEGRHFERGADPEGIGHKSLAVNLSDLAAMGARPAFALLAIALPDIDERWLAAFARGLFALADRHDVELIGGDTTRGPLCLSLTVIGHVAAGRALRRDGAVPGDDLWVSGTLGDAALALALPAAPPLCRERLDRPEPRVQLGARLVGLAHSAIDVSDGLAADVGHIAAASGVAVDIDAGALPASEALSACADAALAMECQAAGGDDYELAFTSPASARPALESLARELALRLSRIGDVREGAGVRVLGPERTPLALSRRGFDHFAP